MSKKEENRLYKEKAVLRKKLREIRTHLLSNRRQEASLKAYETLFSLIPSHSNVLSYSSFNNELDTSLLNKRLISEKRLILSKIQNEHLLLYKVENEHQLTKNSMGILEPVPALCKPASINAISIILVPGLGFDLTTRHRLGYGKGYYDRLLQRCPATVIKWGIGFKEQSIENLPFNEKDEALDQIFLF